MLTYVCTSSGTCQMNLTFDVTLKIGQVKHRLYLCDNWTANHAKVTELGKLAQTDVNLGPPRIAVLGCRNVEDHRVVWSKSVRISSALPARGSASRINATAKLFGVSSLSAELHQRRVYSDDRQITPSTRHHYLGQPNDIPPAAEATGPYIYCSHRAAVISLFRRGLRTGRAGRLKSPEIGNSSGRMTTCPAVRMISMIKVLCRLVCATETRSYYPSCCHLVIDWVTTTAK